MNIRKPLLVAGMASTIALTGVAAASAATTSTTSSSTDPMSSLVDKIAAKFNLKKSDVQAVVDQDRSEHEAARQAEVKTQLDTAVKDGKLTQDQEDKLIAKFKELQTQREANRSSMDSKTDAERKAAMDAERTALDTWASQNNIPTEYLRLGVGHGGHGGPNGGGTSQSSSTTDSSSSSSSSN